MCPERAERDQTGDDEGGDVLDVEPEHKPGGVHHLAINIVDRFERAAENAAAHDGHGDGESHQRENAGEDNLLAEANFGSPEDDYGEAENYILMIS